MTELLFLIDPMTDESLKLLYGVLTSKLVLNQRMVQERSHLIIQLL